MASYSERSKTFRRKEFYIARDSAIGELNKMIQAAMNQYSKGFDTDWFVTSTDDEIVLYREEEMTFAALPDSSIPPLPDKIPTYRD
jgi:hypothetical protein